MAISAARAATARRLAAAAAVAPVVAGLFLTLSTLGRAQGTMAMPANCAQNLDQCSLKVWKHDSFPHKGVTQSMTFSNDQTLTCTSNGANTPRSCELSPSAAANGNQGSAQTAQSSPVGPLSSMSRDIPNVCYHEGDIGRQRKCDILTGHVAFFEVKCEANKWVPTGVITPIEPDETCQKFDPAAANDGRPHQRDSGEQVLDNAPPPYTAPERGYVNAAGEPINPPDNAGGESSADTGNQGSAAPNNVGDDTGPPPVQIKVGPRPVSAAGQKISQEFPSLCTIPGDTYNKAICDETAGQVLFEQQRCEVVENGGIYGNLRWRPTHKYTSITPIIRCGRTHPGELPPPPK
jgi:hypothetical protein